MEKEPDREDSIEKIKTLQTILVVEDDEALSDLIQKSLGRAGFRTEGFLNGAEAIDWIADNPNILLLLDYRLPDMTGERLIGTLAERQCSVPFIVFTGRGDEEIAVKMMKLGARDYLVKDTAFLNRLPQAVRIAIEGLSTERKLAETEAKLRENERRLSTLIGNLSGMAYRCLNDRNWTMEFASEGCFELTGYKPLDLIGNRTVAPGDLIHPDDRDYVRDQTKKALAERRPYRLVYRIRTAAGEERCVWEQGVGIFSEEGVVSVLEGFITDITTQKEAEEQIKASLKEKEILLQEIHHRVKNNMQVISSLLRLQERKSKNERVKEVLQVSQSRIQAMAQVHKTLYRSESFSEIGLEKHVQQLAELIQQTYRVKPDIDLKVDVEDNITLSINQAVPLSLVINELVGNSLRHAFPEGHKRKGEIRVRLSRCRDEGIELVVSDNGKGLPDSVDCRNLETLGLHLVYGLVEDQLDGTIDLSREAGTKFTARFQQYPVIIK